MTGINDALHQAWTVLENAPGRADSPCWNALSRLYEAVETERPHLVDTRRANLLPRGTSFARRLTPGMGGEEWSWQGRGFRGHSATLTEAIAEALDAAERAAGQ